MSAYIFIGIFLTSFTYTVQYRLRIVYQKMMMFVNMFLYLLKKITAYVKQPAALYAFEMKMIAACGFEQRNITIAALSLGIGIGFTQVPEIFSVFPPIIYTVFAENCVAVVFIVAIVANLILPKDSEAAKEE